ncbi:hypothetical protein FOZ62_014977, partial [Perkinsus olseni]
MNKTDVEQFDTPSSSSRQSSSASLEASEASASGRESPSQWEEGLDGWCGLSSVPLGRDIPIAVASTTAQASALPAAVSENPPDGMVACWAVRIRKQVHAPMFDIVTGAINLLNSLFIGVAMYYPDFPSTLEPVWIDALQRILILTLVAEFFIRVLADEWMWFLSLGNCIDAFLVWVPG